MGLNFKSPAKKKKTDEESDEDMDHDDEEEDYEDDGSYGYGMFDNKKKMQRRKEAQEKFLNPDFINYEIPKAGVVKLAQRSSTVEDAQYIIFNGAQARVKYVVVIERNKNTKIFNCLEDEEDQNSSSEDDYDDY